jgi:diacylglycerol kinase (ATP)
VAEGLFKAGTGAALGVIPQGTGNDFARVVGLHQLWAQRRGRGVAAIVEHLASGPTIPVDVLSLNDQLFCLCYCGVGWDALVCRAYSRLRQSPIMQTALRSRLINEGVYALLAVRYWTTRLSGLALQLDVPGSGWTVGDIPPGACALIVSNIPSYAGGAPLMVGSSMRDGRFEVTPISRPWLFALLVLSRYWPGLRRFCRLSSQRVRSLHVSLPRNSALQADGDDITDQLRHAQELSIWVAGQISAVYARAPT